MKPAPTEFLHPWVLDLHWIEQAKVLGALREPDMGAKPALILIVLWLRRVVCRLRDDNLYFYVDGDYRKTKTPTPDQIVQALRELAHAPTYAPALRDALRVVSMHAEAPTDRATAIRFLTPIIEWIDDQQWAGDEPAVS